MWYRLAPALLLHTALAAPALADDTPLTVPEGGTVGVTLGGGYAWADERFADGGGRESLDAFRDRRSDLSHEDWSTESAHLLLGLDLAFADGWQIAASAPLVRNAAGGDVGPLGVPALFQDESLSVTGIGDVTLALAYTDVLWPSGTPGFEPVRVRTRLLVDLPTGSDPSVADDEPSTGDGQWNVGVLVDGYQRVGRGDLGAQLGYTYRDDEAAIGGVVQTELSGGVWLGPSWRISVALLFHTLDRDQTGVAFGRVPDVEAEGREALLSVAPAVRYVRGDLFAALALRAARAGDGLAFVDRGVPLIGSQTLAPLPPVTLSVGVRLF